MIKGDLLRAESLTGLCVANATVVNLAYLGGRSSRDNLLAIDNLADACVKAGIRRLIHCSTVSVFGRCEGALVTEETACRPVDEYETTKMRVEARILEKAGAAFEVVMMRPAAIFGPGGQNLVSLADNLRSRSEVVNYLKACLCGGRRMNLVSVHNVVAAIDASDRVDREIFIVSDDEPEKNNYRFVEGFIKKSFGLGGYGVPILPIPPCVLDAFLRLAGKSNSDSSRAYSGRKLKDLGFKRAIEFDAALGEFAEWRKSVIA